MGLGEMFGKLFRGANTSGAETSDAAESTEYNGFTITPMPLKEGSQYKTAGSISRQVNGELRTARFIRADNHSDRESAISHSERKAQQIIDEQGEGMFDREHV